MKRTTFVGACAIVCALAIFPLAWVNYVLSIMSFALAGILGTIWLVLQHYDWANEQERTKQYHERLKAK